MSVDISTKSGAAMDVTNSGWRFIIEFASRCGWDPSGTAPPDWHEEPEGWDGSYDPAMGQHISAPDATKMGQAIATGLNRPDREQILSAVQDAMNRELQEAGYKDPPCGTVTDKTVSMLNRFSELAISSQGFTVD